MSPHPNPSREILEHHVLGHSRNDIPQDLELASLPCFVGSDPQRLCKNLRHPIKITLILISHLKL